MPRPRGARLIEGFSPKLERRLQFFDHATFAVWIALEATPDVISFCERPSRTGKDKGVSMPVHAESQRALSASPMLVQHSIRHSGRSCSIQLQSGKKGLTFIGTAVVLCTGVCRPIQLTLSSEKAELIGSSH
jgi:hypothetical protein